ncbi:hypothetical protein HY605_02450 [Candidatus Peregrinibacteria bacterium]|nr:hypothetical protein [Candidatus Peregrinibacteria bacterium]
MEARVKKRILLFSICLFLVSNSTTLFAGALLEANGVDWNNMKPDEKHAWLEGFVTGTYMVLNNYQKGTAIDFDIYKERGEQFFDKIIDRSKILEHFEKEAKEKMNIFGVILSQLLTGIDNLYENNKYQKIAIVDAVYVVKMGLTGEKEEIIEAQKRYLLMQPLALGNFFDINWKDPISAEKGGFKEGHWAKPKIDNPQKEEDYSWIPLFVFGIYK